MSRHALLIFIGLFVIVITLVASAGQLDGDNECPTTTTDHNGASIYREEPC